MLGFGDCNKARTHKSNNKQLNAADIAVHCPRAPKKDLAYMQFIRGMTEKYRASPACSEGFTMDLSYGL